MTRSRALLSLHLLIGVLLLRAGCPDATLAVPVMGASTAKSIWLPRSAQNQIVDGKLNVDIPTITLTGRITVNGGAASGRFGTVTLRNSTTGTACHWER